MAVQYITYKVVDLWNAVGDRWKLSALVIVLAILPVIITNPYYIDVLVVIGLYAMLGLGLNVVVGFAGLLDLGYIAFYAIGAYLASFIVMALGGYVFWFVLPISAIAAGIFGVLLGLPTLRMRPDYLALVTMGFGEIVRIALNNFDFTGGPNGLGPVPRPLIPLLDIKLYQPIHFYYLVLALVILTVFVVKRLQESRIGRAWNYIREDELAAEVMGVDIVKTKLLAFGLGATWSGFAGAVFAVKQTHVAPESFTFMESFLVVCIVVLGGMGSIPGAILGAVSLIVLPELLRDPTLGRIILVALVAGVAVLLKPRRLVHWIGAIGAVAAAVVAVLSFPPEVVRLLPTARMLIFGVVIVIVMIFRPEGLWPSQQRRRELREAQEVVPLEEVVGVAKPGVASPAEKEVV
jgi:branched-chain amino acid transport system permease protein